MTEAGVTFPAISAITDTLRDWALRYPIPAWNLARGDLALRLATNWAEVASAMVVDALRAGSSEPGVEFGLWVKARRGQLGMSQRELAERLATQQSVISNIETGANPTIETMVRIAAELGCGLVVAPVPRDAR